MKRNWEALVLKAMGGRDATVQGTAFRLPDPAPEHLYLAGDAASLPALNSLLDALCACEAASTRTITRHIRRSVGVDRHQVTSLGYWRAT